MFQTNRNSFIFQTGCFTQMAIKVKFGPTELHLLSEHAWTL